MRRGLEFKKKARIILVDDNYDHLSGIKELIEIESDFDVVATATSASVAISLIKKYRPEIVLMDINMPEKDGLTAIAEIEKLDLGVRIIALTGYDDPDLIFRAMKIGAKGYILCSAYLCYRRSCSRKDLSSRNFVLKIFRILPKILQRRDSGRCRRRKPSQLSDSKRRRSIRPSYTGHNLQRCCTKTVYL